MRTLSGFFQAFADVYELQLAVFSMSGLSVLNNTLISSLPRYHAAVNGENIQSVVKQTFEEYEERTISMIRASMELPRSFDGKNRLEELLENAATELYQHNLLSVCYHAAAAICCTLVKLGAETATRGEPLSKIDALLVKSLSQLSWLNNIKNKAPEQPELLVLYTIVYNFSW